jgi:hypothetical protein
VDQLYNEYTAPNTVSVAFAETKVVEAPSPTMDEIAACESQGQELNPNGQVLININTNHTVEIG